VARRRDRSQARGLTRRGALQLGGAGALAAALGGWGCGDRDDDPDLSRSADPPNVLLIVTDSTRADYVGAYNPDALAKTPSIDALAKQSLRFTHAVPEAMPTGLVRRALLSGVRTFPMRDWVATEHLPPTPGWSGIPGNYPLLTRILGDAGVTTGYATDNPFLVGPVYEDFRRSLDLSAAELSQASYRDYNTPFTRLADRGAIERYLLPELSDTVEVRRLQSYVGWNSLYRTSTRRYSSARVMAAGMAMLDEMKHRQPFFLGVDAFDPHEPFDPPESEYVELFGRERKGIEKEGIEPIQPFNTPASYVDQLGIDEDTVQVVRQLYAAELTFTDAWIGRLLDHLDTLGLADNTLVIYLSDHGVLLGEHNVLGKAAAMPFKQIYHVPYLMRHPDGERAGETSDYFASTHDVARTVLSTMGVRIPGQMDGEDLSLLLTGGHPTPRPYFTSCYQDTWIAGDQRWLLLGPDSGEEIQLYDSEADPEQLHNVADRYPEKVDELWTALTDAAGGTLPVFGHGQVVGG
jgi:arylsulfatase A-like enzyme